MPLTRNDYHFLQMATINERGGSGRKRRGAILARDNKVIGTGINRHLDDKISDEKLSQLNDDTRYIATINAEIVCISDAIKRGESLAGSTLYISDCPNWISWKTAVTFGIHRFVFFGPVQNEHIEHYAKELAVELLSVGIAKT